MAVPTDPHVEALEAIRHGRAASFLGLAKQTPPRLVHRWSQLMLAADRAEAARAAADAQLAAIEQEMRAVEAQLSEWTENEAGEGR